MLLILWLFLHCVVLAAAATLAAVAASTAAADVAAASAILANLIQFTDRQCCHEITPKRNEVLK